MANTVTFRLSNNNKTAFIDVAQIFLKSSNNCAATLTIDLSDASKGLKLFIKLNKLRLNSREVTAENNACTISDSNPIFAISVDTFNITDNTYFKLPAKLVYSSITKDANTTVIYGEIDIVFYIDGYDNKSYTLYDKTSNMIASNMESFMLMRTNPKLTGNVKLVISDDYKLYLDTFKVSTTSVLNNKEYRHLPISADGNYPHDIYKVFNTLPIGEMYNVYPDSYDPHKNYYDMNLLIENIYEYGAEYNNDNLYSENMKILAPLYIGKHLPTYFAIFKTDRTTTVDYTSTNSAVFKDMLTQSKAVKIVDLRKSTTIGKYLYNYQQLLASYFAGTCGLQFIEQDNDPDSSNYRQGRNTWKGVAIDKGILTDKTETSYFATKTLEGKNPQENYDMFLLNGYSRNKLLYPNILNLEFMFNDEEAAEYSMHNYFGLYLTENDFITFNQIITDDSNGNLVTRYYDENNNEIKLLDTPIDIINNSDYADRIFFASTVNNVKNLLNDNDFNMFILSNVINKPYENYVLLTGEERFIDESDKSFITIDFTKQIETGEHFKFVALNTYNEKGEKENIVLDIIASSDSRLAYYDHCISPYIATTTPEQVMGQNDEYTKIYRLCFYNIDPQTEDTIIPLELQIERICRCISKFDSFIKVSNYNKETISLISSYEHTYFEHILNTDINDIDNDNIDTVRCFNYNNVATCYPIEFEPDLYRDDDLPFANSGLELYGRRLSNIVKFIDFERYEKYHIYEINKDIYDELKTIPFPLISTVKGYFPVIKHIVNECHIEFKDSLWESSLISNTEEYTSIVSPWDANCSLIISKYPIISNNHLINVCSPMACNVAIMGINGVKDIDMQINLSDTIEYSTANTATFKAGESITLDNSDVRLRLYTIYILLEGSIKNVPLSSNTNFILYPDKIVYYDGESKNEILLDTNSIQFDIETTIQLASNTLDDYDYSVTKPELNVSAYYVDPANTETSKLNIPFVPAVNCQWKSNGNYFDNDLILNVKSLDKSYVMHGNFIENTYSPAGDTNNQYIVNKLTDVVSYSNEDVKTIKDMILSNTYKNYIKKYLISNFKLDTAIGYYNPYIQTLNFIYYGINFSFKLSNAKYTNEILLNEFNNYEVYVINNYDASEKNEMIVNKDDEFILLINHTYKTDALYDNVDTCMSTDDYIKNIGYTPYTAHYTYNFEDTAYSNTYAYLNKNAEEIALTDNCKYIAQLELPIYESIDFGEQPIYTYVSTKNMQSNVNYDAVNQNDIVTSQNLDSSVFNNDTSSLINTYSSTQINGNYRLKLAYALKYSDNTNVSSELTAKEKINAYIESFEKDLVLYVISGNDLTTYDINDKYKPIELTLSIPLEIKFNQGLFDPNFIDIVKFDVNDTEISNKLNIDTLYANTRISYIESFKNYFYNKIMSNGQSCIYNYFYEDARSPLSTCWDNNIYRLYNDDTTYDSIKGYVTGIIDKVFFGSTCLKLSSNYIELNDWRLSDANINVSGINTELNNIHHTSTLNFKISLNLTKTFYNKMLNDSNFYHNWSSIDDQLNIKVYINNYITNTFIKLFNFNSNAEVSLYKKYDSKLPENTAEFILSMPEDINDYEVLNNMFTSFEDINNEIILTIVIDNYSNYKFYPIVKIFKK